MKFLKIRNLQFPQIKTNHFDICTNDQRQFKKTIPLLIVLLSLTTNASEETVKSDNQRSYNHLDESANADSISSDYNLLGQVFHFTNSKFGQKTVKPKNLEQLKLGYNFSLAADNGDEELAMTETGTLDRPNSTEKISYLIKRLGKDNADQALYWQQDKNGFFRQTSLRFPLFTDESGYQLQTSRFLNGKVDHSTYCVSDNVKDKQFADYQCAVISPATCQSVENYFKKTAAAKLGNANTISDDKKNTLDDLNQCIKKQDTKSCEIAVKIFNYNNNDYFPTAIETITKNGKSLSDKLTSNKSSSKITSTNSELFSNDQDFLKQSIEQSFKRIVENKEINSSKIGTDNNPSSELGKIDTLKQMAYNWVLKAEYKSDFRVKFHDVVSELQSGSVGKEKPFRGTQLKALGYAAQFCLKHPEILNNGIKGPSLNKDHQFQNGNGKGAETFQSPAFTK